MRHELVRGMVCPNCGGTDIEMTYSNQAGQEWEMLGCRDKLPYQVLCVTCLHKSDKAGTADDAAYNFNCTEHKS
jgi:hypothetical protein